MISKYTFSKRTDWELAENNISQILKNLRDRDIEVLDLTVSNPTKLNFDYPREKILKALVHPENLLYSPDANGLFNAREEVARYYANKGMVVYPHQIFLTASTSEAYSFVFRLLANPQEEVLFPKPSYPLFEFLVGLNDCEMQTYPLEYHDKWHPDWETLKSRLSQRTKAVVVVNPNNPTGSFLGAKDMESLNEMIRDKNVSIVCDEVFLDYMFDDKKEYLSMAGNKENLTFVLGGLSKALGMPQMKLSWVVVSGPDALVQEACSKIEVIADTYLSVNTPSQNALKEWFECKDQIQKSIRKTICSNYHLVQEMTKSVKEAQCLQADGGWYAVIQISSKIKEEDFVTRLLEKDHVFVHPGYFFDFLEESYLVVSLLTPREVLQKGMKVILKKVAFK